MLGHLFPDMDAIFALSTWIWLYWDKAEAHTFYYLLPVVGVMLGFQQLPRSGLGVRR